MNGISNGDGTYKQLSNSDALVGMASDLPNPSKSVTENIKDLQIKKGTASGTTSSSGNIVLSSQGVNTRIVLYAYCDINGSNVTCGRSNGGEIMFHLTSLDGTSLLSNRNTTITYFYVDNNL